MKDTIDIEKVYDVHSRTACKMIHYGNAALVNMNVDDNVVKGD